MDYSEYRPAIPVKDGLKARSTRGEIGESWWARRFIDVLESFALGTRMTRGRAYARKGQVIWLKISPGVVTAAVQGSAPKPYNVSIGLKPFPELIWAKVEITLAEQALFSAKLLSGEMPPGIEKVFSTAGAPLFPKYMKELGMRCSCPDATVPCKHLAATFYLLAEAFDADPFQILAWRGRERDALLGRLRTLRGGTPAVSSSASVRSTRTNRSSPAPTTPPEEPVPVGAAIALAEVATTALADSVDRFWTAPVPLPVQPPTVSSEPDLLLRQLSPPSVTIGGDQLTDRLRAAYQRLGRDRD